ncbi:MAG: flavin reductase family protein [Planctomycetota bacterium]|nr:MAG: flavin reductase family protein [Planctomycetota bacterium]
MILRMATELTPLARALGRIPTGLYLVTTRDGGVDGPPQGFVGSFLMQVGFEPPVVCVAIKKGRPYVDQIRRNGRFGVSILDASSQGAMKAFFGKSADGKGPFEQLAFENAPHGSPVLGSALAWFECKLQGVHDSGDHEVVFGVVESGAAARDNEPAVHLRKNGLGY